MAGTGGLIEMIRKAGVSHASLVKGDPKAVVGGAGITYAPKDLASVISILRYHGVTSLLSMEAKPAAALFIESQAEIGRVALLSDMDKKALKLVLRDPMEPPYAAVLLDSRDMPLDIDTLWRYVEGGKETKDAKFGSGPPTNYGPKKLAPGGIAVFNLSDESAKPLWHKLRHRYAALYQSSLVGVTKIP